MKDSILKEENAIRVRITNYENGAKQKTFIFKCTGKDCDREIKAQKGKLKMHSGKCTRCAQLGVPYMYIYNELKSHSGRNREVTLTFEDLLSLIKEDPECEYCGKPLVYHEHSKVFGKNNSRASQLDRKDNNKDYHIDNVVTCCWDCNRLKSDAYTYEEFLMLSPVLRKIRKQREVQR